MPFFFPFFVMDYVDGQPIDAYCDAGWLGIEDRLRLILDDAEALQYAHQNLVVHRDLKPGNVLVEADGRVRLLDFGVAKLQDPNDEQQDATRYVQRPVTPVFASPEMLRGDPVDVTTDVYSLGVLTYLLITRHYPITYDGLSYANTIARASNTHPPLASYFQPAVGADLDVILSKAMAKMPHERYSSIESLANDIRNYLAGRPVAAKEPTTLYRISRFVHRHLIAVAASIAATTLSMGVTVVALHQSVAASRQRDAALLEQQRIR